MQNSACVCVSARTTRWDAFYADNWRSRNIHTNKHTPFHFIPLKIKYAFIPFNPDKTFYIHFVMAAAITNKYHADNGSDDDNDDNDSTERWFFPLCVHSFASFLLRSFLFIVSVVARIHTLAHSQVSKRAKKKHNAKILSPDVFLSIAPYFLFLCTRSRILIREPPPDIFLLIHFDIP